MKRPYNDGARSDLYDTENQSLKQNKNRPQSETEPSLAKAPDLILSLAFSQEKQ